jgi:hypothetical protein
MQESNKRPAPCGATFQGHFRPPLFLVPTKQLITQSDRLRRTTMRIVDTGLELFNQMLELYLKDRALYEELRKTFAEFHRCKERLEQLLQGSKPLTVY